MAFFSWNGTKERLSRPGKGYSAHALVELDLRKHLSVGHLHDTGKP
jgi:hypothetical protein